ncbi:ATP-binding protein [Amycolatopsis anabasis]|uniref:ATP-binding protein n=1 Tax=Amycolatopsis anabasis TaxID=1840409 RepID=UPI001FE552ED|nr:AAA family ATPase [Amycolatopsis anabasis]
MVRTSSPVLVGRADELRTLVSVVARPPSVIMLSGEAGVGKTRLVTEMLGHPDLAGRQILLGYCQPLREPFPYGVVLEALRRARIGRRGALNPVTGVLRPYLPELAESLPPELPPLGESRADRHRLFRAVRELIGGLGPVLLVVEDLHWSDEGSRQLLRFLMSEPPANLGLLMTYRGEEVPGGMPLGTAFRPAVGTISALLRLGPLDLEGVRGLASALLGAPSVSTEFATRLHKRTAGIPFVVEEALQAVRERGDGASTRKLPDVGEVPTLLREAMLERLGRLSAAARRITQAAAVVGVPATGELLAEVGGLRPEGTRQALIRALDGNVLLEIGDCRYGFRHTLAQQAVYQTIPGPDRQVLHRRAVEALREIRPAPLVQLAEHSRKAGRLADWMRYAEAAADNAIELADLSTATDLLQALLDEPALESSDVDRLAIKLSRIAFHGLAQHEVTAVLERLLTDHRLSGSYSGEVRLCLGLLLIRQAGGLEASRVEIELAVGDLEQRTELAGRGMAVLAQPYIGTTPLDELLPWMDQVEALIDRVDDPTVTITVLANHIASRLHTGDPAAWALIDRVPDRLETLTQQRQLARVYCNIADACSWTGYHRKADSFLHSGIQLATDCGSPYVVSTARSTRVHVDWLTGNWQQLAERCVKLIEEYRDILPVTSELSMVLGSLAVAKGEWDRAAHHFAETGVSHPENAIFPVVLAAHAGIVRMLLSQEDHAGAVAQAEDGLELLRHKGVWSYAGELLPPAVQAYCAAGRLGDAEAVTAELARAVAGLDAPITAAALSACRGAVAAGRGDTGAAIGHLTDARDRYARLPAPYYALLLDERLVILAGERPDALARLADRFDALGATRDAARCRHHLRARGATQPSRRGRRGYGDELSPRERDVARLLADGRTNREIAEVLFLSRRTVEQHVASVLRKLKVSSRQELQRVS